jgi:hypothetical protein
MTISPGQYPITIPQGASFSQQFTWRDENNNPVNLTGYTARLMARESYDSPSAFISLTTSSGITLGGALGTITLSMSATQTAGLPATRGVYDLELVSSSGNVSRLLEGSLMVTPEVTR